MLLKNFGEIKAVGFDIDGTLYRSFRLNFRMAFYVAKHPKVFLSYRKVRNIMHKLPASDDFRKAQAVEMGKLLKKSPEEAEEILERVIYSGMKKYFINMKPCKGAIELIHELKNAGIKIAILSDFPPEQKGDLWGTRSICDVILGTETTGALKPSAIPFNKMAEELNLPAEEILYVGNSLKLDIAGAKNAGMKAAWLRYPILGKFGKRSAAPDFSFTHFKQLRKYLFENTLN